MGQAKQKGTHEQRVSMAKAKIEALKPDYLVCNTCEQHITEVNTMPTRNMPGMDAIFAGICESCNEVTYALKGAPWAVELFAAALAAEHGDIEVGTQAIHRHDPGSD